MVSRRHLYQWAIWICVFLLSSILSCSKSSESPSSSDGELLIKIIDVPANFQHVNIVVVYMEIHRIDTSEPFGWSIVSTTSVGPIDLLSFRNGASAQLLLNKVPVGKYDKIKMHFGTCTVVENGSEWLLNYPLEHVVNYDFEVQTGQQAQLTFDFDVPHSLSEIAPNYFNFTPVIRVQNALLSGWIVGSVNDSISRNGIPSSISTWTGLDSVTTLNDTITGSFQLSALPENLYSLRITPFDLIHYQPVRIDSIRVIKQMPAYSIVFLKRQ